MPNQPPINVSPPDSAVANDAGKQSNDRQWADIVQQLGAETAVPLSAALERIDNLIASGQIDRQGLRALRHSVAQAREAGMLGQQLARLSCGNLQLARERLHLTQMLRSVLALRSRETQARGIQVRQVFKQLEVMSDGSLMFSLLNALMDWALSNTHSSIDLRLDLTPWPVKARLMCRFAHRALDVLDDPRDAEPASLNTLTWRLVEQTAITLGVLALREDKAGITLLTLEFPHTVGDESGTPTGAPGPSAPGTAQGPALNNRPLVGNHLLVLSPRRDLRMQIQAALQHMGLIVDMVTSVEEATEFCLEGLPHGIVFDSSLRSAALNELYVEVMRELPEFCFIEVLDEDHQTQLSTATADGLARISRRNLNDALPSVLLFELSKGQ